MVQPFGKLSSVVSQTGQLPTQQFRSPVQPRRACPGLGGASGDEPRDAHSSTPHSGPNWEQPGSPGMCVSTCACSEVSSSSFSEDRSLEDGIPLNFFLPREVTCESLGTRLLPPCHSRGLPGGGGASRQPWQVWPHDERWLMGCEQMRHTPCPSRCFKDNSVSPPFLDTDSQQPNGAEKPGKRQLRKLSWKK